MFRTFAVSVLLLLFSNSSFAESVEMHNTPIKDFISWYAKKAKRSVVLAPDIKGEITVYSGDVNSENLTPFFVSVLRANGYDLAQGDPSVVEKYAPDNYQYNDDVSRDASIDVDGSGQTGNQVFTEHPDLITRTYKVSNIRAQDMAPVIDIFLKSYGTTDTKVFPIDGANILAINATKEQHDALAAFLPDVDVPRDQVLIESLIFETSEGDSFDFSFAAGSKTGAGGNIAGGVNTDSLGSLLSSAGGSFGIFNGNVLALSLKAVQHDSHAKVLSTPRILTMSGKRGYISVGQNVPFVTGKVTGEAASVNNPFQTIERMDVGVSLDVNPVVTPSGVIIMSVKTRADSISNISSASDIVTNQRQLETTVQLQNGQTLLLGGLIDDRSTKDESSVPLLSRIPLIGGLFTSTSDSTDKRTLYVLIRARVLKAIKN